MKLIAYREEAANQASPVVLEAVRNNWRLKPGQAFIPYEYADGVYHHLQKVGDRCTVPTRGKIYGRVHPLIPSISGEVTTLDKTAGIIANTVDEAIKHYASQLRKNGVSYPTMTKYLRERVADSLLSMS